MLRRMILPLIFGLAGISVLLWLGTWQVQRLAWKEAILADIDARITAEPTTIPDNPVPEFHKYLPVRVQGRLGDEMIRVLVSQKQIGAGYRIISPLDVGGRKILVDRGFVKIDDPLPEQADLSVEVIGNLHWPEEIDQFTPEPDLGKNIWFARDIARMAQHLGTDPALVVMREPSFDDTPIRPLAVGSDNIPNDHLQYAITWLSLAVIWLGMTLYLLWRIRQRTV